MDLNAEVHTIRDPCKLVRLGDLQEVTGFCPNASITLHSRQSLRRTSSSMTVKISHWFKKWHFTVGIFSICFHPQPISHIPLCPFSFQEKFPIFNFCLFHIEIWKTWSPNSYIHKCVSHSSAEHRGKQASNSKKVQSPITTSFY